MPLLLLRRFQLAGHLPIALAGGATGMIGDPGGRSEERNLLDGETLDRNTRRHQGAALGLPRLRARARVQARLVDNRDWTEPIGVIEFLRDVGKHITVNYMLAKESVRRRASRASTASRSPSSATCCCRPTTSHGCTSTWPASCRPAAPTSGATSPRASTSSAGAPARPCYGLTVPLITRSDGEKFGKSAEGALWLDPARTSPYALYQYFVNLPDADVERYLLQLTLVPVEEARRRGRRARQRARAPRRPAAAGLGDVRADPRRGGGRRGRRGVDGLHERGTDALGEAN